MYAIRPIRSQAELQAFRDGFCSQLERRSNGTLRLNLPVERLALCTRVMGVFDRRGALVGGYAVHDGPEWLILRVTPPEVREAWLGRVGPDQVCELNFIWRNAGIGHTAFAVLVWPRIIAQCVGNGRRHIVGSGYDNPLNRWYSRVRPELIYAGPSLTSGLDVYVYAYTRPKLVATYCASFVDDLVVRARRPR
jgi:hypothetical protein